MPEDPVTALWSWWSETGRGRVRAGIEGEGVAAEVVEELQRRLDAIAPGLAWELRPGSRAEHAFVIGAGGDAELQDAVARIHQAAPDPDDVFEYLAARGAREGGTDQTVTVEGREFDLRELSFAATVDDAQGQVDVQIHHPGFSGAPEELRAKVAFIALDWLLGEQEVERWIGDIELPDRPPEDARPFPELAELRPK